MFAEADFPALPLGSAAGFGATGGRGLSSSPDGVRSPLVSVSPVDIGAPALHGASAGMASVGLRGRATSYADVAAFEAGLHCAAPPADPSFGHSRVAPLVGVSCPARVVFDQHIENEIFSTAEEFSALAAIFRFRGFWPSLSVLHAWISEHWEPILGHGV